MISYGGLVVCCSNTVFKLSIPELNLEWKTQADFAACFGIYYLDKDYLVHGELEITRLNKYGQIVWQRSGRDIWTTPEGYDDFGVFKNYILATDWRYYRYKFNFNGKLLEEYKINPQDKLSKDKQRHKNRWWKFWK